MQRFAFYFENSGEKQSFALPWKFLDSNNMFSLPNNKFKSEVNELCKKKKEGKNDFDECKKKKSHNKVVTAFNIEEDDYNKAFVGPVAEILFLNALELGLVDEDDNGELPHVLIMNGD